MILLNLCGGPCTGKSAISSFLHCEFKFRGLRAELVGEAAKPVVLDGTEALFENQVLMTGMQYQNIHRLHRSDCEIAIADSPLIQGIMYAESLPYYEELKSLIRRIENQYRTYNIWMNRGVPFDEFGRSQKNIAEAARFDPKARKLIGEKNIWMEITGSREDGQRLLDRILKELL